jgi:Ca2+-binding RTX toxin-like protein
MTWSSRIVVACVVLVVGVVVVSAATAASTDNITVDLTVPNDVSVTLDNPPDLSSFSSQPIQLEATYGDINGDNGTIEFMVCTDSPCGTVVRGDTSAPISDGVQRTWQISPTLPDGTYWWMAIADDGTDTDASSIWSFTLSTPPPTNQAPSIAVVSPSADSSVNSMRPNLTATFSDPDLTDVGTVAFELCSDSGCATVAQSGTVSSIVNGAQATWAPTTSLTTGLAWWWRVRATDPDGAQSSWTTPQMFRVASIVIGGNGGVTLTGSTGDDSFTGGSGDDALDGGDGDDTIFGGLGNDTISGCKGNDRMFGGAGRDVLQGCAGNDLLSGDAGNDVLRSAGGNDNVKGGAGNDKVDAGAGNDRVKGGPGNDLIVGGAGKDVLAGNGGNDRINARERQKKLAFSLGSWIDSATIDLSQVEAFANKNKKRDKVTCGKGNDKVKADKQDKVATDCEWVNGRRKKFR